MEGRMRITEQTKQARDLLSEVSIAQRTIKTRKKYRAPSMRAYINEAIKDDPIYAALAEIRRAGGLNHAIFRKTYGKEQLKDLIKRHPCLVTKGGKAQLDVIAMDNRFESEDRLLNALIDVPPKRQFFKKVRREMDDNLANTEWQVRGFEETDGVYPETLTVGDQLYMGGEFFTVCGVADRLALVEQESGRIERFEMGKLPCEAILRKGKT
jgi:hypothetical protein